MIRKGWHGIRRAWRHCHWAGCKEPEVAPWQQVCAFHLHEHDRLAEDFKQRQLPLPFWFLVAAPPPIAAKALQDTQLEFAIPWPKLKGARGPEFYAEEQSYEEIRAEILRDKWNELKDQHQKLATRKRPKGGSSHGRNRDHNQRDAV